MTPHLVFPSWSTCSELELGRPLRARRRRDEKVRLPKRLADAPARNVKVFWLDFDAGEPAAHLDGGNASRAATAERIEDHVAFVGKRLDEFPCKLFGNRAGCSAG